MLSDDTVGRAAAEIADGHRIDWDAVADGARTPDERDHLACLRIVDAIARTHRAVAGGASSAGSTVPGQPTAGAAGAGGLEGRVWGRYQLLQEVGAGSYGSVYRAFDPELEFEVAIKILHRHVADAQLRQQLLQEGRALAKVRDDHVVKVLGVESSGDRVGLCMEFVHGDTLEHVLSTQGTLNAREAMLIGEDVCRALSAVHAAGFVHRDVKLRNIMRDRKGRIVLMDFGTGRAVDAAGAHGPMNIAGTPPYMAPEVLAGVPATAASDVYSVGVLLYHLVTGRYPVEGASVAEIKAAHMLGRRTPMSEHRADLPLAFVQVVERALAPNPSERWGSAGALLEALGKAAGDTPDRLGWGMRAAIGAALAIGVAVVLTALGWMTSFYFNDFMLGRSGFVRETPRDWLFWGATSLTTTVLLLLFSMLIVAVLTVLRRLALRLSALAARIDASLRDVGRRAGLDDVAVASYWALLFATAVVAATWWTFAPFLGQLIGIYPDNFSTAPAAKLRFLSSEFRADHENYRIGFLWSTIACGAVWYPVVKLAARKREPLNRLVMIGGAAVFALSLLLLTFPYRMLVKCDLETARWQGMACYVMGERGDDVLVFCPELAPPRSHAVPRNAPDLKRLGVIEDVLTRIRSAK